MLTQTAGTAVLEANRLVSYNPATEEPVGSVPLTDAAALPEIMARGKAAQSKWAALPHKERVAVMFRFRTLLAAQSNELALLISQENGKPLTEALSADILPVVDWVRPLAAMSRKLAKPERIGLGKARLMGRISRVEYDPYGVVAVISPWNYPFSIPAGECMQALLCGNAVILKPSEETPLIADRMVKLFHAAGVPQDVLQVVHGAGDVGAALINARPDKIAFTGAVSTGRRIGVAAVEKMIPVQLELGGKAPMVVLADCNLEKAVEAAVWGAFMNSGQTCAAVERCYVERPLYDRFVAAVVARTKEVRQGDGLAIDVEMGPMTRRPERERVHAQVQQALSMGAKALTGGKLPDGKGWFYPPTVLVNVDHRMDCVARETFGPLLPIMAFDNDDDAIRLANDSTLGLTGSVWSTDLARADRIARKIETGTVMINETTYTFGLVETPWGGRKDSGLGWTHGMLGMHEFVQPHHIHTNKRPSMRDPWWFPYTAKARKQFELMIKLAAKF